MKPNDNNIAVIPELKDKYIGVTSGLTPGISLDIVCNNLLSLLVLKHSLIVVFDLKLGHIKKGDKVLITAASGANGIYHISL